METMSVWLWRGTRWKLRCRFRSLEITLTSEKLCDHPFLAKQLKCAHPSPREPTLRSPNAALLFHGDSRELGTN
jgi:hypothetical protein